MVWRKRWISRMNSKAFRLKPFNFLRPTVWLEYDDTSNEELKGIPLSLGIIILRWPESGQTEVTSCLHFWKILWCIFSSSQFKHKPMNDSFIIDRFNELNDIYFFIFYQNWSQWHIKQPGICNPAFAHFQIGNPNGGR